MKNKITRLNLQDVNKIIWEPKIANRFTVHITDEITKKHIIEPHLIKYIDRPSFELVDKKYQWHPIKLKIYEPIVPGLVLFRCLGAGIFNIQVNEMGPVGDVIETWVLPHCRFESILANPLDWSSTIDVQTLDCVIDWSEVIVKDGEHEFKIYKN